MRKLFSFLSTTIISCRFYIKLLTPDVFTVFLNKDDDDEVQKVTTPAPPLRLLSNGLLKVMTSKATLGILFKMTECSDMLLNYPFPNAASIASKKLND